MEQKFKSALPSRRNINRDLFWYIVTVQMENKDPMTFLEEQDKQLLTLAN